MISFSITKSRHTIYNTVQKPKHDYKNQTKSITNIAPKSIALAVQTNIYTSPSHMFLMSYIDHRFINLILKSVSFST